MPQKRLCYGGEVKYAAWTFPCTKLAEKYMAYGMQLEAIEVLKVAARARPLCIDNWVRLASALAVAPLKRVRQAKTALQQVAMLNNTHHSLILSSWVDFSQSEVVPLEELLTPAQDVHVHLPFAPQVFHGAGLDHVFYRRRLQRALQLSPASTETGRSIWADWARYMTDIWWVCAAAAAIEHLEVDVDKDVQNRPWMKSKAKVLELLEVPPSEIGILNVGVTYERMLRWTPSIATMLSPEWLADMEARGGYYDSAGSASVKFATVANSDIYITGLI